MYRFSKEIEGKHYTLPNFQYYSHTQVRDSLMFDVIKYARLFNKDAVVDSAVSHVRKYSDSIIKTFELLHVYKIDGNIDEGSIVVFFLDKKRFVANVPNKFGVRNVFWREKFNKAIQLDSLWLMGEY